MKKKLLLSLSLLTLAGTASQMQAAPVTKYIKPTLKGAAALACFYGSYKMGQFGYYGLQVAHDISKNPSSNNISIAYPFQMAGFIAGLAVGFPSLMASLSTGILGVVAAKSAYDDIRKINQQQ